MDYSDIHHGHSRHFQIENWERMLPSFSPNLNELTLIIAVIDRDARINK